MSCGVCGLEWSAHGVSHCRRCHQTFSCQSAFDLHLRSRVHAGCREPVSVTTQEGRRLLVWNDARQLWQHPGSPPSRRAPGDGL